MSKLNIYFGDIHNHCGASYGQGAVEDAIANAQMQLDFATVTGHALWPDMPRQQHGMERRIKYHEDGFTRLAACWEHFCSAIDRANKPEQFVSFLSYELHSCADGDRTVLYRDGQGEILPSSSVAELERALAAMNNDGTACMAIPHHIGYQQGFRGINWQSFDSAVSPVVEIFSMHGCSESDWVSYPYLHSMGPCDYNSTLSAGLLQGHIVGVMASTDHHSAHPGSHGHGRMSVHAAALTRASIWEAIRQRRTVALTGDNITVDFALNDAFMGEVIETPAARRQLAVDLKAGAAIRAIELLKNERVIKHIFVPAAIPPQQKNTRAKIALEVGWGSRGKKVDWEVMFGIQDGILLTPEPRFKGADIVSPAAPEAGHQISQWRRENDRVVTFSTVTEGNPTTVTNSNQGFSLEVEMPVNGRIVLVINGHRFSHTLGEVLAGAVSNYIDGYGTPAYRLTVALPEEYEYSAVIEDWDDCSVLPAGYDIYRLRVEQHNRQWAWSSPIWIKR